MKISQILFFLVLCFLSFNNLCAQENKNLQGIITYKAVCTFSDEKAKTELSDTTIQDPIKQDVEKGVLSMIEETEKMEYELKFNSNKSLFSFKETLQETPNNIGFLLSKVSLEGNAVFYKNIKKKQKVKQEEYEGELINVIEPFQPYEWTITKETKTIVGYKCFKATSSYSFMTYDGRDVTHQIVAWFTKDIPVPFGPKGYDGLPGVILEIDWGDKFYFYASKVQLGKDLVKDKDLALPKGGNEITDKEWEEFHKKEAAKNRARF